MLSCPQNHWAMAVWSSGHAGESLSSFSYYPWMTDTVDTVCRESQKLRVCASATKKKLVSPAIAPVSWPDGSEGWVG